MVGRDFKADEFKAMRVCAGNVPRHTWADVFRAWDSVGRQLPGGWREQDDTEWKRQMFNCTRKPTNYRRGQTEMEIPSTKEVYQMRKQLKGMVMGPLDKNNGELWVCCPRLYHKALKKAYAGGYERIYPARLSQYRKRRYNVEELPEQILRKAPMPQRQKGAEKDLVDLFARIYGKRGWSKYAKFNRQGGFNQPYILFKAKNMVEHSTRRDKWMKVRPIAPGTKHPMRRLMHYVGRAWSFVTARIPGDHFVINKTSQVPTFLREAQKQVAEHGQLRMDIYDIESCYPNMPRETIRFALRDILKQMETKYGYNGVWVPKWSDKRPCAWKSKGSNTQKIPFHVMLDVMEFSLDFALVRMPNGQILRQTGGIPMGDALSPGMTIGACAWMEQGWLETIDSADKKYFMAKRFMDDIAIVYADCPQWDSKKFIADFAKSQCYQEPLKLEPGKDGTFLETRVWINRDNTIRHKLKNDNEGGQTKIWRYKHFDDGSPFMEKRATLTACLKKVEQMASDGMADVFATAALDKIAEFRRLRYPLSVLTKCCTFLGASTGVRQWYRVRDALR